MKTRAQIESDLNNNGRSVMYFSDLKAALDYGASVYVCKVERREPSLSSSDRNIERGKVTLSVTKVMRGPNRQTLVLPYSFGMPIGILTDGPLNWPIFEVGDSLMCVVVPGTHDPSTVRYADVDEAARWVENMKNPSAEARKIEAACDEYNKKAST